MFSRQPNNSQREREREREREYYGICSNQRDLKWREPEIEVGFIYIHRLIKRVR